jgi:hypothetical protein
MGEQPSRAETRRRTALKEEAGLAGVLVTDAVIICQQPNDN